MHTGTVIILNGPSAAGKSSIQRAFQECVSVPYLALGIDGFFNDIIPDEHGAKVILKADPKDYRHVTFDEDSEGNPLVKLHIGPEGDKVIRGMHGAIAAYARAGNNVIVDYIAYEDWWAQDLRKALSGLEAHFIKVDIPLETLEIREKNRGTSPVGHARSHYHNVYDGFDYDLIVNTDTSSPDDIARQIWDFLGHP